MHYRQNISTGYNTHFCFIFSQNVTFWCIENVQYGYDMTKLYSDAQHNCISQTISLLPTPVNCIPHIISSGFAVLHENDSIFYLERKRPFFFFKKNIRISFCTKKIRSVCIKIQTFAADHAITLMCNVSRLRLKCKNYENIESRNGDYKQCNVIKNIVTANRVIAVSRSVPAYGKIKEKCDGRVRLLR